MILNPAIIALITGSFLLSVFAVLASVVGAQIIRSWDLRDGSDRQLAFERRTYLLSTIFTNLLVFELLSFFLFIYTADDLHSRLVGAMCAAGSLNANIYGYPTLFLKTINFIFCGLWLIVNHADNQAVDYPLIRFKYRFLIGITILLVLETLLQTAYFAQLRADVITSCCGTLFSTDVRGLAGGISSIPPYPTMIVFYSGMALTVRTGMHHWLTRKAALTYSFAGTGMFIIAIASMIIFVSVYYYEQPTHHCPFCILQKEYHYLGYPLYLALFCGVIGALGVGVLERFRNLASLAEIIPRLQRKLCLTSMIAYISFGIISTYPMVFHDFTLKS